MDRWREKVAVVTGASAGIGLETAKSLVQNGLIVVGLARRKALMEENMKNCKGPGVFYPRECDVTKKEDVVESLNWVKEKFGYIDVLVNNAGTLKHDSFQDSSIENMERVINLNVNGLMYCTKHFVDIYEKNPAKRESHIININSVLGHIIPLMPKFNIYPASKHAVRALSDTLRYELQKTKIRVTSISPGLVRTAMMEEASKKMSEIAGAPALKPENLADAVIYVLSLPPCIEINELKLTAKPI